MPATFLADGSRLASLREHMDPATPTKTHAELTKAELVELVVSRLERAPASYQIAMFGVGPIDKERAVYEVKRGSRIGAQLIELERLTIAHEASALGDHPRAR